MKKKYLIYLFLTLTYMGSYAQDYTSVFEKHNYIQDSDTLRYRIMFPEHFDRNVKYPLVLILHGAGERGNDNENQLKNGASLFISDSTRNKFPAIVVFPQCPKDDYWANVDIDRNVHPFNLIFHNDKAPTRALSLVMNLIDKMANNSFVNNEQIYVGGLSMGGMGTLEIMGRKPHFFAAGFAICGGAHPDMIKNFSISIPVWIFHGAKDDIIDPINSLKTVQTILDEGGYPNFTLYANDNHNSWDSAFAEPNLLNWLFSNKKKQQ
jgi:predicted peptidase